MRQPSKYVERTELDRKDRECWAYRHALRYILAGRPDATETVKDPDDRTASYRLQLFGADACHGGILLHTFRAAGQPDTHTAYYWEDYKRLFTPTTALQTATCCAIERLQMAVTRKAAANGQ